MWTIDIRAKGSTPTQRLRLLDENILITGFELQSPCARIERVSTNKNSERWVEIMDIIGDVGNKRLGIMNKNQILEWLINKEPRKIKAKIVGSDGQLIQSGNDLYNSLSTCVESIMSASAAPGGGNTTYRFDGEAMHHTSKGAESSKGMTIFYIKRPGNVAKVIGMGYHIGAQTYQVTWKHRRWVWMQDRKRITLD